MPFAADHISSKKDDPSNWDKTRLGIATTSYYLGNFGKAMTLLEEVMEFRRKDDEENESNLQARTFLGKALLELGKADEAEKELATVYKIKQRAKPTNPLTYISWCNWANALRAKSELKKAEEG